MGGQHQGRTTTRHHRGRLWLVGAIALSGQVWPTLPSTAQDPVVLAPLPLRPITSANDPTMKLTPFCLPADRAADERRPAEPAAQLSPPRPVADRGDTGSWPIPVQNVEAQGGPSMVALAFRDEAQPALVPGRRAGALPVATEGVTAQLSDSSASGTTTQPLESPPLTDSTVGAGGRLSDRLPGEANRDGSASGFSLTLGDRGSVPADSPAAVERSLSDRSGELGKPASSIKNQLVVEAADEPMLAPPTPAARPAWSGQAEVKTALDAAPPTLTKIPISGRIVQVPVTDIAARSEETTGGVGEAQTPPATENRERRLINGAHPKVDVSVPPLVIERGLLTSVDLLDIHSGSPTAGSPTSPSQSSASVVAAVETVFSDLQGGSPTEVAELPTPAPVAVTERSILRQSTEGLPRQPVAMTGDSGHGAPIAEQGKPAVASEVVQSQPGPVSAAEVIGQLRLQPTEVRSVMVPEPIRGFQSDSPGICTALITTNGKIQVIATGVGVARLTLDLGEDSGSTRRVAYEVTVGGSRAANDTTPQALAAKLNETVSLAFPGVNARVLVLGDRLELAGIVPDEATAKQLLRMVRSACPLAVNDRLSVR